MSSVDVDSTTKAAWDTYNRAVDRVTGTRGSPERDAIDNAVAELATAERAAVLDQLYLVAQRPDSPVEAEVVRPVRPLQPLPGDVRCSCGRPAVTVFHTEKFGDVPSCRH